MADGEQQSLLDPATLRTLLEHLEQTDVHELEIVNGSTRLYLRREPGQRSLTMPVEFPHQEAPRGAPIMAPLAGLYYSRPTPADPPYVEAGSSIVPGQVVALIETMKIFNEIKAEIAGEVTEIMCRDGDLVEVGKPLLYVRPSQGEQE